MNDQDEGKQKEGQPNKDPPLQPESSEANHLRASARQGRRTNHQENGQGDLSETETKLADRIKQSDIRMIALTAAIVVLTGVNVLVFYRESKGSAKDIKQITVKAGDMVTAVNHSMAADRTAIQATLKDNRDSLAIITGQIRQSLIDDAKS